MLFYSASQKGFYDDQVHAAIPADAKPVSEERYIELLAAQELGRTIIADAAGHPVAVLP